MTRDELAVRLLHASVEVIISEEELVQEHADAGQAMVDVASAVSAAVAASDGSIKRLFSDVARGVARLEGSGPGVSFWASWLDGLAEAAPEGDEAGYEDLRDMFDQALDDVTRALAAGLCDVAPTDALAVASVAISSCDDELDAFDEAADAVEESITGAGLDDPVSLSLARFLRGMTQA